MRQPLLASVLKQVMACKALALESRMNTYISMSSIPWPSFAAHSGREDDYRPPLKITSRGFGNRAYAVDKQGLSTPIMPCQGVKYFA